MFLTEDAPLQKLYVIITDTQTFVNSLIQTVMGTIYNHVSFSLDLREFYTFALDGFNGMWGGFKVETMSTFKKTARYVLFEMEISLEQFERIKKDIQILRKKSSLTYYDHLNLVNILLKKKIFGKSRQYQAICSTFVRSTIKKHTGVDVLPQKPMYMTEPSDFMKSKKLKKISEGFISELG